MSFLTQYGVRRAAPIVPRAVVSVYAQRPFTTSLAAQKTATDSVKDGLKKVDRAVSDKIVTGIDAASTSKYPAPV